MQTTSRTRRTAARGLGSAFAISENLWAKPLQCIPDLLRELGVPPEAVFRRSGIRSRALADPRNRLDFTSVGRLAEQCAAATGCFHFGLLAGQRAGPQSVGIIHELMSLTATLRSALFALRSHLHLHDRGAALSINEDANSEVEIAYVIFHPHTPGAAQIADGALAILLLLLRSLLGPGWKPLRVAFAHRRPRATAAYHRFFQAPVQFDAPRSAIFLPAGLLSAALPGADARRERAIRRLIAEAETANPLSVTLQVKRVLTAAMVAFRPSIHGIAAAFGMSGRTLRRRLADEGTSFTQLLDEISAELARQLLVETRMSIHDIGATLHYSRPGAFSRAYKAWTGVTPLEQRRSSQRAAGDHSRIRQSRPPQGRRNAGSAAAIDPDVDAVLDSGQALPDSRPAGCAHGGESSRGGCDHRRRKRT